MIREREPKSAAALAGERLSRASMQREMARAGIATAEDRRSDETGRARTDVARASMESELRKMGMRG